MKVPSEQDILAFISAAGGRVSKRKLLRHFALQAKQREAVQRVVDTMLAEYMLSSRSGRLAVRRRASRNSRAAQGATRKHLSIGTGTGTARATGRATATARGRGATEERVGIVVKAASHIRGSGAALYLRSVEKNHRYDILISHLGDAQLGELVRMRIVGRGIRTRAKLIERLGAHVEPTALSQIAIRHYEIPDIFSDSALAEAEAVAQLPLALQGREDLRDLPIIAIDPADARDRDDAIWAVPDSNPTNQGGWQALVAIADVSYYVRPKSALDREARERGNSVYFPDRCVPMLPEILSAGVCSLAADEDRAALVCHLTIDKHGRVTAQTFARALIRLRATLSYHKAQAMFDALASEHTANARGASTGEGNAENPSETDSENRLETDSEARSEIGSGIHSEGSLQIGSGTHSEGSAENHSEGMSKLPPEIHTAMSNLWGCWQALALARDKRAPLALDLPERRVCLDASGKVTAIDIRERFDAHRLVEDFMIAANVAAAKALETRHAPIVYRVHEPPSREKLSDFASYMAQLGHKFALGQTLIPSAFNRLIDKCAAEEYLPEVMDAILRTQTQACYQTRNVGHFGLALSSYAHFTSPIRRYADLLIHRALVDGYKLEPPAPLQSLPRAVAQSLSAPAKLNKVTGLGNISPRRLEAIAEAISGLERRAMVAERETVDRYIAAWLAEHVGEIFAARIRSVHRFGFFVVFEDLGGDGFVPMSLLGNERFYYDGVEQTLTSAYGEPIYRVGQRLRLRLLEANIVSGKLSLQPELAASVHI